MTNKKKYQAPAFKVIKLKSLPCLNQTSLDPADDPSKDS